MKPFKLAMIATFSLFMLSGCTINVPSSSPKSSSNSTSTQHIPDNNTTDQRDSSQQSTPVSPEHQTYLKKSQHLASQGKVIGCEFAANKNDIQSVEAKYGQPDSIDRKFGYHLYNSRQLAIAVGKGDIIKDVRSFDPKLHAITRSEVVKTLGIPTHIRHNRGDSIYVYDVNGYEFKLIFRLNKDDPTIAHISVYSPKAAYNPMAN